MAMTTMAPRSSMTASASNRTRTAAGTRLPSSVRIPTAKAMSVAYAAGERNACVRACLGRDPYRCADVNSECPAGRELLGRSGWQSERARCGPEEALKLIGDRPEMIVVRDPVRFRGLARVQCALEFHCQF